MAMLDVGTRGPPLKRQATVTPLAMIHRRFENTERTASL